jgi:hypothetical protein
MAPFYCEVQPAAANQKLVPHGPVTIINVQETESLNSMLITKVLSTKTRSLILSILINSFFKCLFGVLLTGRNCVFGHSVFSPPPDCGQMGI